MGEWSRIYCLAIITDIDTDTDTDVNVDSDIRAGEAGFFD